VVDLETVGRANAEESGIAGDKRGNTEASASVAGVDDVFFI